MEKEVEDLKDEVIRLKEELKVSESMLKERRSSYQELVDSVHGSMKKSEEVMYTLLEEMRSLVKPVKPTGEDENVMKEVRESVNVINIDDVQMEDPMEAVDTIVTSAATDAVEAVPTINSVADVRKFTDNLLHSLTAYFEKYFEAIKTMVLEEGPKELMRYIMRMCISWVLSKIPYLKQLLPLICSHLANLGNPDPQ